MTLQKNNPRTIKISVTAAEDFKDIWDYVAQRNETAAGKLVKEINRKLILLRDSSLIGREQNKYLNWSEKFRRQRLLHFLPSIERWNRCFASATQFTRH